MCQISIRKVFETALVNVDGYRPCNTFSLQLFSKLRVLGHLRVLPLAPEVVTPCVYNILLIMRLHV